MTARGPYKPREPGSLKEAVTDLVTACGGKVEAAKLCRVSPTQITRYSDDTGENSNFHMPVDIVQCLEAHCGDPIVTRFLAMQSGSLLIRLHAHPEPYAKLLGAIGRETGKFYGGACEALGTGKLSPPRAGRVMRDALQLAGAIAAFIGDLRKIGGDAK